MTSYKPHIDDLPQNYELDFLDNFKDLYILSKVNNITNNVANIPAIDILNPKTSRLPQSTGSTIHPTIYWSQVRWWPRTNHIRIGTQHHSRRRRRRFSTNGLTSTINEIIPNKHPWKKMM